MIVTEQIKILCVRQNISSAELARRLGMSSQNLSIDQSSRENLSGHSNCCWQRATAMRKKEYPYEHHISWSQRISG